MIGATLLVYLMWRSMTRFNLYSKRHCLYVSKYEKGNIRMLDNSKAKHLKAREISEIKCHKCCRESY